MTTVVLADDHDVVRQGLCALLADYPDISVIGQAKDGLDAVAVVERLRPHVLVVDLVLPGLGGLDVTREVVSRCRETRVVVLSVHANEQYVVQALRSGAMAYVLKDSGIDQLVAAIRSVATGKRYLCPWLSERAIDSYMNASSADIIDPYAALTMREREVMHLAAEGLTNTEIATRLSISPRTAEIHRSRVMHKLELRNQSELIRHAIRNGILSVDSGPRA